MRQNLVFLTVAILLCSCGAESGGSQASSSTDTISSSSTIRFNTDGATLSIVKAGGDVSSKVPGLENVCSVSLSNLTNDIPYDLISTTSLEFGPNLYSYKRALKTPKTKAGIEDRIFSVWSSPDRIVEGVTLSFELELEPELMTFRLSCST
jgi:hypothetical protein